jgi:hypothetical protein
MSTIDMRTESQQILERIDERFLAAVHALLKTYEQEEDPVVGYDLYGNAKTAEATMDEYEGRLERVKQGEYLTMEALKKEAKSWLTPTE